MRHRLSKLRLGIWSRVGCQMSKREKTVQPDQDSNLGPFAYWANDLPAVYTFLHLIVTKAELLHSHV